MEKINSCKLQMLSCKCAHPHKVPYVSVSVHFSLQSQAPFSKPNVVDVVNVVLNPVHFFEGRETKEVTNPDGITLKTFRECRPGPKDDPRRSFGV